MKIETEKAGAGTPQAATAYAGDEYRCIVGLAMLLTARAEGLCMSCAQALQAAHKCVWLEGLGHANASCPYEKECKL